MSTNEKHPILIVDDEPDVLFSLKGLLRHNFRLYTAESGEEALQIMREHSIHVILTDQRMPGMTGVQLMQYAKAMYPDTIRIVFTGYADIKAVVEAINTGGLYRYITKPWDPDELIEVLSQAAARFKQDSARQAFAADIKSFAAEVLRLADSDALATAIGFDVSGLIERANSIARRSDMLL